MTVIAEPPTVLANASTAVAGRYDDTYRLWITQQDAVDALRRGLDGGPGDEVDAATLRSALDEQIAIADSLRGQLDDLRDAADRESAGKYGVCESCGSAIPAERLEIFPATTLCVSCKSRNRA
jgi:DnaK suppressor protein